MQEFSTLPAATVSRPVTVSAEAIWMVLSELESLASWAPGIDGAKVTSDAATGVGAVREVATAQFGTIVHEVTDWTEGAGFAYVTADSGPFARTLTVYDIAPKGDEAEVTVTLSFEVKPGAIEVDQAKAVLSKGLGATLQALELRARMAAEA